MHLEPTEWSLSNVLLLAIGTLVNAAIWRKTARWMVARMHSRRDTYRMDALSPSYAAQQAAEREGDVDPLRQMYDDAVKLAGDYYETGERTTRRKAQRKWKWSAGQWNRAYWFCKKAGVFDKDGELIIDYWNDVEILLEEFRYKAAELKRSPNFVFPR